MKAQDPTYRAIVGATLIDGTGSAPLSEAVVIVNGDQIETIGARSTIKLPPDTQVIDTMGK